MMVTDAKAQQQQHITAIGGRVTDATTGESLENCNVYLAHTTIGTSTDSTGRFSLSRVPGAAVDLVVSRAGYERSILSVHLFSRDTLHRDVALIPLVVQSNGMDVVATPDAHWIDNLDRFTKAFLGRTEFSGDCTILNPYVLNFRFANDTLVAWADSLLQIDNRALGYRLRILLTDFVWNTQGDYGAYAIYPLFEPLPADNQHEQYRWQENRKKAYEGSLRHFLRSLSSGSDDASMFTIATGTLRKLMDGQGHRVSPRDFHLEPQAGTPLTIVHFAGCLRVEYGRRLSEKYEGEEGFTLTRERIVGVSDVHAVSFIQMRNPSTLVDSSGNLLDPRSIEVAGAWANSRVSTLLPTN